MTGRPHHHQKVSIDLASKPSKTLFKELLKQVEDAYKNIHQNGYQVENLSEYRPLIEATNEIFSKALSAGVRDNVIPDKMMNALENDVFLFSALKTHAQLFEASRQLLASDGTVKSYQQFSRDVEKIKKDYNQNYLQAEYNFAVASAQQAANWAEIEHGDEDYLLQYRTAEDDRVRDEHQALAGTTLPSTDAFWDEFYPPNGWNCRCVAVEVRNKDYKASDSKKAIEKGKKATESLDKNNKNRLEIFRFNPGKQKVIFPPKHPYRMLKDAGEISIASGEMQIAKDYEILKKSTIYKNNLKNLPERIRNEYPNVDIEKINSVNMYTGRYYYQLNNYNRGRIDKLTLNPQIGETKEFWKTLTKTINQALDEIPDKFTGTVYRGVNLSKDVIETYKKAFKNGSSHTELGFTSTSYYEEEAFDGNVKFFIESKTGTKVEKIANISDESEVLFKAGQQFKITNFIEYDGNVYDIFMEEI